MSKRDCSFNIFFDAKIENLPYNSKAKKVPFLDNSFKEWKPRFQGFFGFWNIGGILIFCIENENININGQNNDNAKNQNSFQDVWAAIGGRLRRFRAVPDENM